MQGMVLWPLEANPQGSGAGAGPSEKSTSGKEATHVTQSHLRAEQGANPGAAAVLRVGRLHTPQGDLPLKVVAVRTQKSKTKEILLNHTL